MYVLYAKKWYNIKKVQQNLNGKCVLILYYLLYEEKYNERDYN